VAGVLHLYLLSDICCAFQAETFTELECTLTADLAQPNNMVSSNAWHGISKTTIGVLYLRNCNSLTGHVVNWMFL